MQQQQGAKKIQHEEKQQPDFRNKQGQTINLGSRNQPDESEEMDRGKDKRRDQGEGKSETQKDKFVPELDE